MTRSPSRIMPKSAIALPTSPRRWDCRRCAVRDRPSSCAWVMGGILSGGSAAGGRLEILALEVAHEGGRREGLAGGFAQQFLQGQPGALGMHPAAQPAEQSTEVAPRDLLVEFRDIVAHTFDELHGDDGAQGIGGEVTE